MGRKKNVGWWKRKDWRKMTEIGRSRFKRELRVTDCSPDKLDEVETMDEYAQELGRVFCSMHVKDSILYCQDRDSRLKTDTTHQHEGAVVSRLTLWRETS